MERIVSGIKEALILKKPFAVYCKPGSKIVTAIFQDDTKDYSVDFSQKGFVFAPFAEGKTIFIPTEHATVINAEYNEAIAELPVKDAVPIDAEAKCNFENLVVKSVQAIKNGEYEKLVCSRTETVVLEDIDVVKVYKNILSTYINAFRYCFYHPDSGLWMGATPEQLLKMDGDYINTVALAGTQLYQEDKEIIWAEKEKQEQQFVTDYIVSGLSEIADSLSVSEPYTFRAGNIVHIKTDIGVAVNNASLQKVINILHPTPAVCGLPKHEVQEFLIENEGYNREYYSGYLGEIGGNQADLFVNLRCMKIKGNSAQLFIGCGITEGSNPEKEFIETVNKSITMRRVL